MYLIQGNTPEILAGTGPEYGKLWPSAYKTCNISETVQDMTKGFMDGHLCNSHRSEDILGVGVAG